MQILEQETFMVFTISGHGIYGYSFH